uniref:Bardet-Biedl syndrome 1 n=1 Tax=Plectus sambesii TaxID=2011161 RepID=A0A914WVW3_9BILA
MNATVTAIECFWYEPKQYLATLVALDSKEIQMYQETFLVDQLKLDDVATSLKFGKFGREEGALVIGTKSGGLLIKLFKRTAKLEEKSHLPGPPQAQSQKLNVPKKTKIFVDQTMRERYEGQRMHQIFQRDLFMLRLHTAQAYSRTIEHSLTPVSFDPDDMVKISAVVQGFGPTFLMIIYLRTLSVQAVSNLTITFQFNPRLYSLDQTNIPVPMLVPGIEYTFQTKVSCLMPDKGLADDVKVLVVRQGRAIPLLTALVTMPISEQSLID